MLQKDYNRELIDLVQELAEWEILNKPIITAIIIAVEEQIWPLGLTPYNVRQIVSIEDFDMSWFTEEEIAEDIIDKTYNTSFVKTFKKVKERDYILKSRLLWSTEDFLKHLQTFIEWYKPHKAIPFELNEISETNKLVIALTDLHLGKQSSEIVAERLWQIVDDIVEQDISHVDIFCVWDLVETLVQWWMHDWQIETMWNSYWFELLMNVVEIFEDFLISITHSWITVNFYWLSGNHDRMTKDREGDKSRLGWLVIYELIKRWLMNMEWIEINIIQDYITNVDIDNIRYIVAHGDMARIPKRKWTDIAWTHWDNTKSHNVILFGHLHNVSITEERSITKIGLPGLAWVDAYATKELDLHSEPAYVQIEHNEHWSVDILIKRLQQDV